MKRLLLLALCVFACRAVAGDTTVFAAASLSDVLTDLGRAFNARGSDTVRFSFAASSTLAKQIESGAPAGLFLSADEAWMDYLEQRSLIVVTSRRDLLTNALVLIEPEARHSQLAIGPGLDLATLLGSGRLAMGDPDSVPAGKYGREALTTLGLWNAVKGQIAPADSVRSALALVERGEAPFGVVYATDALATRSVHIAGVFPERSHKPIVYPVAIVAGHDTAAVRAFLTYLQSAEAQQTFRRYGFSFPAQTGSGPD